MAVKRDVLNRRLDLNLLVAFEAIYKVRSLTAAGHQLGLSQPAMSHALAKLRSAFDDALFVRVARGLEPTPFAEQIVPKLQEALAMLRRSLERTTFDPATSTRVFSIAQGDLGEVAHLPLLLRAIRRVAPHVRLRSREIPAARLTDALAAGEVDLASGTSGYKLGAACREAVLYDSEYACVVRADHPSIRSKLTLSQFKAAEHILVKPEGVGQHGERLERLLAQRNIAARIAVQVGHFHAVPSLITCSDMVATVPRRLAEAMMQVAAIKILALPVSQPKFNVSLYWHERFHKDPENAWLRSIYTGLF